MPDGFGGYAILALVLFTVHYTTIISRQKFHHFGIKGSKIKTDFFYNLPSNSEGIEV